MNRASVNIYSLYDTKTMTYNKPFIEPSDTVAMRSLRMEVNRADPNNVLYMFPEDYRLYRVGSFDTDTGNIDTVAPELVVDCETLVSAKLTEKTEMRALTARGA